MKTANYFNSKLTELLNNRGIWINANQASNFAKWCKTKKAILAVIFGTAFAFINSLQIIKIFHIHNTIGFNEYNISLMILSFIVLNIFIVGGYCLIRIDLKD